MLCHGVPRLVSEQQKTHARRVDRITYDVDQSGDVLRSAEAHRQKKIAAGKLKEVINMSKVILDVKPWDDTTDMEELEKLVRTIKHETQPKAIEWQAAQLEDIGYGVKKLRIMVQVIDDEVSVDDDIVEKITEFEDYVQSCDIFAFNKV